MAVNFNDTTPAAPIAGSPPVAEGINVHWQQDGGGNISAYASLADLLALGLLVPSGAPALGDVLTWDGSPPAWTPEAPSGGGGDATEIQGIPVSMTAPTAGQVLEAQEVGSPPVLMYVPVTPTAGGGNFADNVTPAGDIDGSNRIFTLPQAPNPPESLHLYRNGLRARLGDASPAAGDFYYLSATEVEFFVAPVGPVGSPPVDADWLLADYRY